MIHLITASVLAMLWATGDADKNELKQDLVAIGSFTVAGDVPPAQVQRIERTWKAIEDLPQQERVIWTNTFTAVLLASGGMEAKGFDQNKNAAAINYYREILAALGDEAPDGLKNHVQHALALTLTSLTNRLPPAQRKPLRDSAVSLDTAAVVYFADTGDDVMLVSTLAELSFLHFNTGVEADDVKARRFREQAVEVYERLPQSFMDIVDLDMQQMDKERVVGWAERGYSKQAEVYLLLALDHYNAGLTDPASARESIYLYAESLRVGFVHRQVTAIDNAGVLLLQRTIGTQTGKARRIRQLLNILKSLPDTASNPHWRQREITKADEAVRWIHARVQHYLGEFYLETGQALLARHNFNEAEQLAKTLEDGTILPLVLYSLAESWAQLGVVDESLRVARQALDSRPPLNLRADILLLMGRVCQQQDDFALAQDYHRWALDLFVKPGSFNVDASNLSVMAKIQRGSATMQLNQGNVADGLQALGEAAGIAAIESPEDALQIQLDRLQYSQWIVGSETIASYTPSMEVVRALDVHGNTPFTSVAVTRGPNFSGTVQLNQPKLEVKDTASKESISLTTDQIRHVRAALRQRAQFDTSQVVEDARQKIAALQPLLQQRDADRYELARMALIEGDLDKAEANIKEELDLDWRTSPQTLDPTLGIESPQRVQLAHHLGVVVAARRGELEQALQRTDMSRHRALWQVHSSRQHVWDRLNEEQRIEAARLDDARSLSEIRVRQLSRQAVADPRIGAALQQAQRQFLQDEAQWKSFTQKIHQGYQLEAPSMQPVRTSDVKSLLVENSVLLSFSVGDYETCVIAAVRRGDAVNYASEVLPIRRHELNALVNALRMGCSQRDGRYRVFARELYRVLIAPMEKQFADARLLVICPDGPLNVLPFSVLENQQGEPLLERYPISVIPSIALLKSLREKESAKRKGALLVGMQKFENRVWVPSTYASQLDASTVARLLPQYQLSDLQQTRTEVERIASLFENESTVLIDEDASEAKVNSSLAGRRYLHFATHGLIDSHNPFASALVLATPGPQSREDGFLEASEILENPAFSGAELVTLSACESGLGLVQGGEGVLGLTWAFLAAGNRGVVSSLWNVDDDASAEMMVGMYRELVDGRHKAEALRSAGLKVRANSKTSHAAYWAAYQFTGDWSNQDSGATADKED